MKIPSKLLSVAILCAAIPAYGQTLISFGIDPSADTPAAAGPNNDGGIAPDYNTVDFGGMDFTSVTQDVYPVNATMTGLGSTRTGTVQAAVYPFPSTLAPYDGNGFSATSDTLGEEILTGAALAAFGQNDIGNHGFIDGGSTPETNSGTIFITNLLPSTLYQLTIYGANYNANPGMTTEDLDTTYTATGLGGAIDSTSGTLNVDHNTSDVVVLDVTSTTGGEIDLLTQAAADSVAPDQSVINALRIDDLAPVNTPEPSTYALLLGGVVALLCVVEKRRRKLSA